MGKRMKLLFINLLFINALPPSVAIYLPHFFSLTLLHLLLI